ncbi:hypothetical protein SAMN02744775_00558 [Enterobacter sp. CC120223-11]|nr:hypothetical protein SAMN02744775_00558 [Enterobacter sp. CC120223-11]
MIIKNLNFADTVRRIIHHELGHWLMSRHVGFDTGEINIGMLANHKPYGQAIVYPSPKSQLAQAVDIYDHLLSRTAVLCAGVIADIGWHKRYASSDYDSDDTEYLYANGVMDATGLSDSGKIEELLYVMNGIKNPPSQDSEEIMNQRHKIRTEAWLKASEFIDENPILFGMGEILIKDYFENAIRTFQKCYLEKIMLDVQSSNSQS